MSYIKKKDRWCVADFETKTEQFYLKYGYTEVWLYAVSNPDGEIIAKGTNIDDFMVDCSTRLKGYTIYFHNLKFDGSFIFNWLLRNGYEWCERTNLQDIKKFSTLIGEDGAFYQITVNFYKNTRVVFLDSLKLLPFSARQIAIDFELPVLKGSIDYNNYEITDEAWKYIYNDVIIIALALKDVKANGMLNMTTASCAYNNFMSTCFMANLLFPDLEDEFLDNWREAYRGGRSQVNPLFAGKILNGVKRYDINSMYPYIMHDLPLPIGKPIPIADMGEYTFELYHLNIDFELKEGHLPTLLKKHTGLSENSYYINSEGIIDLYISNIDFELLTRHYDILYMDIKEMYGFRTTTELFKSYIDKWYEVKTTTKGAKKQVEKLMLNSLYGKFGSKNRGCVKIPYLDETGTLAFTRSDEQPMKKYYLPVAIAIVSWAHLLIDNAIVGTGYDNFVYCDTDSVHTLGYLPPDMVHQKDLGKFKLEAIEEMSRYVRQKTYIFSELHECDGKVTRDWYITCAGMDERTKQFALDKYGDDLINRFEKGFTVEGTKLMPEQVPGGIILRQTSFQIKED